MTRLRRCALVALVALAAVAAACSTDGTSSDESTAAAEAVGSEPPSGETGTVRIVSQNLLHGIACPPSTDGCRLSDRVDLFARQLDEGDCPELVGIQEANEEMVDLLEDAIGGICDGEYAVMWDEAEGIDREVVLSRLRVLGSGRTALAGPLRTAFWVRVAADVGVVDLVTTHLASGSDDRPCDRESCPPPCLPTDTLNICQGRQVVEYARQVAHEEAVVVIAGDLNARVDSETTDAFEARGFTDAHLAAGLPECDRSTGDQCTSGRADDSLTDLTDPQSQQSTRIDYVFFGGDRDCTTVGPTGLFNGEPAVDDPTGLAFPSDHTAVEATLECDTSEHELAVAPSATVPPTTTSTTEPLPEIDARTRQQITAAYETVFDGDVVDLEAKLAALQDGEQLRPFFIESYEAQGDIVEQIRVRVDAIELADTSHANVTYSLLLDGAAVLDHLPGQAVREGGNWLVARRTYCDVSTQGADEIPAPCR